MVFVLIDGKAFHKDWSGDESIPEVNWNQFEAGSLDDSLVMMLMMRYRQMGYETYLVPQNKQLPFSNTREDILVRSRHSSIDHSTTLRQLKEFLL